MKNNNTKIKLVSNFNARQYQQSTFANIIDKNALVIFPTGLGKTIIAIMLTAYYYNKTGKKVLFLAPTKPLVEQQEISFKSFFENSDEFNFQVLTGLVSPQKRKNLYKENDFIFSTPQLIENDIINKLINPEDFCLIIIDEAHRATGNYAYCFIAQQFKKYNSKLLALTASPGTKINDIKEIMLNLGIDYIEVKKQTDSDVSPYIKKTKIKKIYVDLSDKIIEIKNELHKVAIERIKILQDMNYLIGKRPNQISKTDLLNLQKDLRVDVSRGNSDDENIWKGISYSAGLMKLQYGIELFESQEISAAHSYFYNFFRANGDRSKAAVDLTINITFRECFDKIAQMHKENVLHPKLIKLKEIVNDEILKNQELKIIIFSQYRDSAQKITEELSKIKEVKPRLFLGQAKKGDVKMSQKDQKKVLEEFREGKYNILVSTSVGEEGLDIPKVDLVIFYEPLPSAIRTIQRIGRTGRFNEGKAYILISQGTRDVMTSFVADAKERRMYKALDKLKKEHSESSYTNNDDKKKSTNLNTYIEKSTIEEKTKKTKETKNHQNKIKNEDNNDKKNKNNDKETEKDKIDFERPSFEKPLIYIDSRENTDLIKELYKIDTLEIECKKLNVGDIVISQNIAIERKAKVDFVNSIIDKRLFPQLLNLAKNYRRPLLIIEGEENLFSIRNLNPNVIRATLSAIAIDLRVPIIYTNSLEDTAQMIQTITKRTQRVKKEISLVASKMATSENEEMEKFVSSIPKINVVNSKNILSHFHTIKKFVNAKKEKLILCEGIGKTRAEFIIKFFERKYE